MRRTSPDLCSSPWAAPSQPTFRADIRGALRHVSHAGALAVSVGMAKTHCKIETGSEDNWLVGELKRAERYCENMVPGGFQIMPATFDLPVSRWWRMLTLPRKPLQSVTSVKYFDVNNAEQTAATTYYNVFAADLRQPGTVELAPGQTWPDVEDERDYPITVRFIAGCLAPVTAVAATNVLTSTGRAFHDNDLVRFWNSGGVGAALPTPLKAETDYYVRDASGATFKVTDVPGGTAIDVTDAGTGLHYAGRIPEEITGAILMLVEYWYRFRGAAVSGGAPKQIEFGVRELLESAVGGGAYR